MSQPLEQLDGAYADEFDAESDHALYAAAYNPPQATQADVASWLESYQLRRAALHQPDGDWSI
jgi:hypothetical protein